MALRVRGETVDEITGSVTAPALSAWVMQPLAPKRPAALPARGVNRLPNLTS
jgi:hypothetical protein